MKSIYLFCTKPIAYWVYLPIAFLLSLCIHYNDRIDGWLKLYPLIIVCCGAIIFTAVFFFRLIEISYQEIRYIGRFTSRDSEIINAGKTLVLIPEGRGRVRVYMYGRNEAEELVWMRDDENEPGDICLFRGKCYGGLRSVSRVLSFFGASESDVSSALESDSYANEYENAIITTCINENEKKEYRIKITKTV